MVPLPPQIIDGDSFLLQAIGSGLWPAMVLLSEIVQTFILADFWCACQLLCFRGSICMESCQLLDAQEKTLSHSVSTFLYSYVQLVLRQVLRGGDGGHPLACGHCVRPGSCGRHCHSAAAVLCQSCAVAFVRGRAVAEEAAR